MCLKRRHLIVPFGTVSRSTGLQARSCKRRQTVPKRKNFIELIKNHTSVQRIRTQFLIYLFESARVPLGPKAQACIDCAELNIGLRVWIVLAEIKGRYSPFLARRSMSQRTLRFEPALDIEFHSDCQTQPKAHYESLISDGSYCRTCTQFTILVPAVTSKMLCFPSHAQRH